MRGKERSVSQLFSHAHSLSRVRTPYNPAKGDAIHTDGRVDVNVASVGRQVEGKLLERALLSGAHHEGLEALVVRVDHEAGAAVEAEAKDPRGGRLERVVDELTVGHLAHGKLVDGEAEGRDRIEVDVAAHVLACTEAGSKGLVRVGAAAISEVRWNLPPP